MSIHCRKVVPLLVRVVVHQHVLIGPFGVHGISCLRVPALVEGTSVTDRQGPVEQRAFEGSPGADENRRTEYWVSRGLIISTRMTGMDKLKDTYLMTCHRCAKISLARLPYSVSSMLTASACEKSECRLVRFLSNSARIVFGLLRYNKQETMQEGRLSHQDAPMPQAVGSRTSLLWRLGRLDAAFEPALTQQKRFVIHHRALSRVKRVQLHIRHSQSPSHASPRTTVSGESGVHARKHPRSSYGRRNRCSSSWSGMWSRQTRARQGRV